MAGTKKRNGCLTAWLTLALLLNGGWLLLIAGGALLSWVEKTFTTENLTWDIIALLVLLVCQIACLIALFRWKKWGFWGLAAVNVAAVIVEIAAGAGATFLFSSVVSMAVLYGVLNIGNEDKGWPQLE